MTAGSPAAKPAPRTRFFLAMAGLGLLIVLVGFSRRYFLPLAAGTFHAPAIVHAHGLLAIAWVALFAVQATLVATRRVGTHRRLGLAGIALAALLVFTAAEVAVLQLARELAGDGPAPREFVAILVCLALTAATLAALGFASVDRPELHKRYLLLASFVVLTPALARIIQLLAPGLTRLARNDLSVLASDALVLAALAFARAPDGRPRRAYVTGAAILLVAQGALLALRTTPAWVAFTDWLAGLVA
jgi:hypothetical protein